MTNPYGAPEISVYELEDKLQSSDEFVILDVREEWEILLAALPDERVQAAPLSQLSARGLAALPEAAAPRSKEVVVLCHHGVRSAEVSAWLLKAGWQSVVSVAGGLEDYATYVDPGVGRY